jgi:adenylate kinase family enzyme
MYGVKEVCVPVLLKKSYGKKVKRKTPLAAPVESGELRGRADDTPATIERRLGEYRREAKMIEDFYGRREFHRIDATGSEQEVFAAIRAALGLP